MKPYRQLILLIIMGLLVSCSSVSQRSLRSVALDPAIPGLIEKLKRGDAASRLMAISLLSTFGEEAEPALPEFIAALKDSDVLLRVAALRAIAAVGSKSSQAVPAICQVLSEADQSFYESHEGVSSGGEYSLHEVAAQTLFTLGPRATDAIPSLLAAIRKSDKPRRGFFVEAIASTGKPGIPALLELIQDDDQSLQASAANAFTDCTDDAKKLAAPTLIKLLSDQDLEQRRSAALALRHIGPFAKDGIPVLLKTLEDEDQWIRETARDAFAAIGKSAVPYLLEALRANPKNYLVIAQALSTKISVDQKVLPELIRLLD